MNRISPQDLAAQAREHLSEDILQGLADGSFRGPAGMDARAHCDACPECAGEVELFRALSTQLSALADPPPPLDFTVSVLAAVEARELSHAQHRHTLLAAIPAAFVALLSLLGWVLSAGRLDQVVGGLVACRRVLTTMGPVLEAARLPLGLAAFCLTACVLFVLQRALRPASSALQTLRS